MTVKPGDALTSISRDPLPFMLALLGYHALPNHWTWLGILLMVGFLVSVLRGSLRADAAPLPNSRQLPKAAVLGCMAGCGLWSAVVFASFTVMLPFSVMNAERLQHDPLVRTLILAVGVWLAQSWFCAGVLAQGGVKGQPAVQLTLNGFFAYLGQILARPPFNLSGLLLVALVGGCYLSSPLLLVDNALLQAIPLLLATLYAHGLGQYLRKGLGFELS